jgi:HEPN domain-containing protein
VHKVLVSEKPRSIEERYGGILNLFRNLAKEKRYSPIDRMARALNPEFVRASVYEALRIAVSEGWSLPSQEEVERFLEEAERNLGLAQRVAIIALTAAPTAQASPQAQQAAQGGGQGSS